jgi:2-oxo-3-(phosphooxy)propyl 3-oxoalkanoate synthase
MVRVVPRLSNWALFDHSYDHLTMQALTQAALAGIRDDSGRHTAEQGTKRLAATFARFAELDALAVARAALPAQVSGELILPVTVQQGSENRRQV